MGQYDSAVKSFNKLYERMLFVTTKQSTEDREATKGILADKYVKLMQQRAALEKAGLKGTQQVSPVKLTTTLNTGYFSDDTVSVSPIIYKLIQTLRSKGWEDTQILKHLQEKGFVQK